jgi:large subunit ribosomal protein L29
MNAKELRTKDSAALTKELRDLQRAHFSLRMQLATQQITNTSQLGKTKRDVARVKTVINEAARKATSK